MTLSTERTLTEDIQHLMNRVIDAAAEVHHHLGPGYGESVYVRALCHEFDIRHIKYEHPKEIVVLYKGVGIHGQWLDMLVEEKLILELKAVEQIAPIHEAQLLSCLQSTGLQVGLIINFNVKRLRSGIKRVIYSWPL